MKQVGEGRPRETCLVVRKSGVPESGRMKGIVERVARVADVDYVDTEGLGDLLASRSAQDYLCIVTMGGDGTVLKAASIASQTLRRIERCKCVIMGKVKVLECRSACGAAPRWKQQYSTSGVCSSLPIFFSFDFGSRGRLCNVKEESAERALCALEALCLDPSLEALERLGGSAIVRGRFEVNETFLALNDVYIFGCDKGFLSTFSISINSLLLYSGMRCDGVIVSTSSGSSGYTSSAAGPIVSSKLACLVITAVCPVDGRVNPIVIDPEAEVCIECKSGSGRMKGILDGCISLEETAFRIKCSKDSAVFTDFSGRYEEDLLYSMTQVKGLNRA